MSINPDKVIDYFIAVITTQQEVIDDGIIDYSDVEEEDPDNDSEGEGT